MTTMRKGAEKTRWSWIWWTWICWVWLWLLNRIDTRLTQAAFMLKICSTKYLGHYPPAKTLLSLTVLRPLFHTLGSCSLSFIVGRSDGFVHQHRMALRMVIILAPSAVSVPYPVTAKSRWKMTSIEQAQAPMNRVAVYPSRPLDDSQGFSGLPGQLSPKSFQLGDRRDGIWGGVGGIEDCLGSRHFQTIPPCSGMVSHL